MSLFAFPREGADRSGAMTADGRVRLSDVAEQFGTPCYVVSESALLRRYGEIADALERAGFARPGSGPPATLICYSVKANSSLGVLSVLKEQGTGFDIVSGGELERCVRVGARPDSIVFAGVGKTEAEIEAALRNGVRMFNVESDGELDTIERVAARLNLASGAAPVALRLNPDVDPQTHTYITTGKRENKFGLDLAKAESLLPEWKARWPHVSLVGLHCHIGSQITQTGPYLGALDRALPFLDRARELGHAIANLNLGGGFAVDYEAAESPDRDDATWAFDLDAYFAALAAKIKGRELTVMFEPGRSIAAPAAVLVTRVVHTKRSGEKTFAIVDAAMNDLMRPSLYGAHHGVLPVASASDLAQRERATVDVVGPICESGDFLAKDRTMPLPQPGDLLAIAHAGAYALSMASQYNSRPRAPEVLVKPDGSLKLIRRRETMADLLAPELDAWGKG